MNYDVELQILSRQQDQIKSRIEELQVAQALQAEALERSTPFKRVLAVALHGLLCTLNHGTSECTWETTQNFNDPEAADWSEDAHRLWMDRTLIGVAKMQQIGFEVVDPS